MNFCSLLVSHLTIYTLVLTNGSLTYYETLVCRTTCNHMKRVYKLGKSSTSGATKIALGRRRTMQMTHMNQPRHSFALVHSQSKVHKKNTVHIANKLYPVIDYFSRLPFVGLLV